MKESAVVTNGSIPPPTSYAEDQANGSLDNLESVEEPSRDSASVNPVYELSLCPEIGEKFGSNTTSLAQRERKSEEPLPSQPATAAEKERHQAAAALVQTPGPASCGAINFSTREKAVDVDAQSTETGCDTHTQEVVAVSTSCALPTAEKTADKTTKETPRSQPTADSESSQASQDQLAVAQAPQNTTMATQAAQPSGEIILPQMEQMEPDGPIPSDNDNASTPPDDASPMLDKVSETTGAPAEDRLSSSESPEPSEEADEALAGAAKASGSPRSAPSGGSTAAGVRADPDGKGATAKTKKKEDKSIGKWGCASVLVVMRQYG